jgi:serine/threonine-protein kinase
MVPMLLTEGSHIRDTYEIDRFLGEGAFAEVYRVKHKFLGRQAMKVFKSPSRTFEEVEEKLSEAMILSRIGHPNIIRVFDAGILETTVGQCGYFTMEYVAGGNLESFWRSYGASFLPLSEALEVTRQICVGLAVAHAEQPPIIHRDIKPPNILVGYDAGGLRIRVSDFGLAKKVNSLTLLASAKGTPAFKPPECLSNIDSCAADVWAIGTTLYLLLTDRVPYPMSSIVEFSSGKRWERPLIPASRFNPQVPPTLDAIVFKALALRPADRYADAAAMLEDVVGLMHQKSQDPGYYGAGQGSADRHKSALGSSPESRETPAKHLLGSALALSRDASRLMEAADLLEQALNRCPEFREEYEYQLRLWRRGIVT